MVRRALIVIVVVSIAASAAAATRYDPRLRFRTIRTAHFDIHAHQGEEALAARLALVAESVRAKLERELGAPRGRVQVILVDQADIANGWATPAPYDAIEIAALPAQPESFIGNTTDWLELVFTHEYTHIVHLDRTRGWMRPVRAMFGRNPVAFPNAFLPAWQIEGIATYEESRQTGQGRVSSADFRSLVDVAAREGRFEPRDRASGGLVDWPSGNASYAYGAYFHQFLEEQYGQQRIAELADATAGRVPFFSSGAFTNVFGKSVDVLWREFRESREGAPVPSSTTDQHAVRLTHHGFAVGALHAAADGTLYYALWDAHRFPALMAISPAGTPRRIAWRYSGVATALASDWIVFDQVRLVRSVAQHSDLYAVPKDGGRVRRLTDDARAGDPDVSPDGKTIACTVDLGGRHAIATLPFDPRGSRATPHVLAADDESDYASPRWSRDGTSIAAVRRHAGRFELVIVDAGSGAVRTLLAAGRIITPAWTPDGRAILFAMDEPGRAFNIFAADPRDGTVRRVTDSATGARLPQLSADGRTLYYVGYTTDGFDVVSVATDPADWSVFSLKAEAARFVTSSLQAEAQRETKVGAYNPLRTLVPTYWTPIVSSSGNEVSVGGATAMADALGRHLYAADAAWSANRARPDWHASYAYDRWLPTLFVAYSDETDPAGTGEVRTREFEAGTLLTLQQVRYANTFLAAFDAERDSLDCPGGCNVRVTRADRRSVRGGWLHDSRRAFGYSISAEEGALLEVTAEASHVSTAGDTAAGAGIADVRLYQRVRGHSVIALRAATALSWGDPGARRVFSAGGPGPAVAVFDFGRDTIGLLRGFEQDAVVGTRAAVVNADFRFPVVRPQRGAGSWPVFLRALHGAVFADAGQAWDTAPRFADARVAAGGELSFDTVLGFYLPITFTAGAAWTRDPAAPGRHAAAIFGRIGHAF